MRSGYASRLQLTAQRRHGAVEPCHQRQWHRSLQHTFTTDTALRRRARNAPHGAFLAIDFVMVPHAGLEMEGLSYHYSGQARTQLGHQFTSTALVKFGADPTPLLERFNVARLLEPPTYPYRTATQEMMHTVTQCRDAGVPIAGVLLDGECGRDDVVTFTTLRSQRWCAPDKS